MRAISCISHSNLVRLVGFCAEGREQILIYEFCANGTLTQHIRPKGGEHAPLSFCRFAILPFCHSAILLICQFTNLPHALLVLDIEF